MEKTKITLILLAFIFLFHANTIQALDDLIQNENLSIFEPNEETVNLNNANTASIPEKQDENQGNLIEIIPDDLNIIEETSPDLDLLGDNQESTDSIISSDNTQNIESDSKSVSVNLIITNNDNYLYNQNIDVLPCDSDKDTSTANIATPYCAILQTGILSEWNWQWAPGAFIESLGGIKGFTSKDIEGNDVYHYWSWSLNGNYGETGLNQYELNNGDDIVLEFIDPKIELNDQVVEEKNYQSRGGGSSTKKSNLEFSEDKIISFLSTNQKNDGSFGDLLYTDWVAIALGQDNYGGLKAKLFNYLQNKKTDFKLLTDYERHVMALMVLGIDPYNGTETNYIERIKSFFDGEQMGDRELINDDIFALLILSHSGYNIRDEIMGRIINYLISKQSRNGSFGEVDLTAAYIQAMAKFRDMDQIKESIKKAENYLIKYQKSDGSFGNIFSTSWAIQALLESGTYQKEIDKAIDYLKSKQKEDGSLGEGNYYTSLWATSYALPAIRQLSWNDLINDFSKPEFDGQNNLISNSNKSKKLNSKQEVNLSKFNSIDPTDIKASVIDQEIIQEKLFKKDFFKILKNILFWPWININF